MNKILQYIAKETQGECFTSSKYCYDNNEKPAVEYEDENRGFVNLKEYAEDEHKPMPRDLRWRASICMQGEPLFKYFLDGSRRVYKVDDIQYDRRVFPIVSGQIAVTCCERLVGTDNAFQGFRHICEEAYPVLCLPVTANCVGEDNEVFFDNIRNNLNALPEMKSRGVSIERIMHYSTKLEGHETYENKGIARIQDEMTECEKRIVAQLVSEKLLTQNSYLIKDGSIQYKPMKSGDFKEFARMRNNYRHVVGVSKKFNPNLMKDHRDQSSAGQIARLPLYHRTPAFLWQPGERWGNVKYAIWYVRIRDIRKTESPYAGVLKVEKMLITDSETERGLSTDEIDTITANLVNERNPVCYGTDARWANHLYPVYLTERYCKSRFLSDTYFLNLF